MNERKNQIGLRIADWLARSKDMVLTTLAIILVLLSVLSMVMEQQLATIGYLAASGAVLVLLFPSAIETMRVGNFEMKLRQIDKKVAEVEELAKLIAEIAIPLAHQSEGWADFGPSRVQTKDTVIARIIKLQEDLHLNIDKDVLDLHYIKTCADYEIY